MTRLRPPRSTKTWPAAGTRHSSRILRRAEVHATAMSVLSNGERESRLDLSVLKDVIRRLSATPGSRNVILASPGFFLPNEMRQEEAELMDRAIRANVTLNSLDVRGVYTLIPGGDASERGRYSVSATNLMMLMKQNAMSADSDVMEELADATGGQFFHNDNGLFEGFRQLVAQPEYIYILGFSPQNLKLDGTRHALKVALKNPKGFRTAGAQRVLRSQPCDQFRGTSQAGDSGGRLFAGRNPGTSRRSEFAVRPSRRHRGQAQCARQDQSEAAPLPESRRSKSRYADGGLQRVRPEWELRRRNSEDCRLALARPDARLAQLRHHCQDNSGYNAGKLPGEAGGPGFRRANHVGPQRRGRDSVLARRRCREYSTHTAICNRALPGRRHAAGSIVQRTNAPADSGNVIRTETRLVLVDAVVTDKKGNYIRDLTAKDFRVWEDKKEQTVTSFSLEGGAPAPGTDKQYVVFFFDATSMSICRSNQRPAGSGPVRRGELRSQPDHGSRRFRRRAETESELHGRPRTPGEGLERSQTSHHFDRRNPGYGSLSLLT